MDWVYRKAVAACPWPRPFPAPAALVVPDATRPARRAAALEALEPVLPRDTTVVVAGGLHPARAIDAPWPVAVHDARDPALVDIGTAEGIAVLIHPAVARARAVVAVGAVMPHYARTARAWWDKARRVRTLLLTELDVAGLGVERVTPEEVPGAIPPGALPLLAPAAQELLFS